MACPDCFRGYKHDGTPLGKETKIHGLQTYVAEPPDGKQPKGIITIIPDAFGMPFMNNKLLADHYASGLDYLVYLPDFMKGTPAPVWLLDVFQELGKGGSIWAYLWKPYYVALLIYGIAPFFWKNTIGASHPRVTKFLDEVRCNEGRDLPVGIAGFCWGGKHGVIHAIDNDKAANGKPLFDSIFTGHPSAVGPTDFEKVKVPFAVAVGTKDMFLKGPTLGKSKEIVEKLDLETEFKIYKNAGHGFCVRADPGTEEPARQAREAEDQAVAWFKRTLKT